MTTKDKNFSKEHLLYLRRIKRKNVFIILLRSAVLVAILTFWEIFARIGVIDSFISSYPSEIAITTGKLFKESQLLKHIGITLFETFTGFIISVVVGYATALLLWWSNTLRKTLEPYIVVLNSLPKIALGPIIIIWFGSGQKSIIAMTVLISIIVCILTMLGGFLETDEDKILLLKSLGASKIQIMLKLVVPSTLPCFMNTLKISLGMAWIGSIMGEYLVSKAGLGYLIVYGGQVFKLDLVMASTVVLLVLSGIMYAIIASIERLVVKNRK